MRFLIALTVMLGAAAASPRVPSPTVRAAKITPDKLSQSEGYEPTPTHVHLTIDGATVVTFRFSGKRVYDLNVAIDAECKTARDVETHKSVTVPLTAPLCKWIKDAKLILLDFRDRCVKSHGCDL